MESPTKIIKETLAASAEVKKKIATQCTADIEQAAHLIADAFKAGNKLLLCGNGGSAADAQHIATELIIRLSAERSRMSLPAVALTTDTSTLTAGANDFGFERVFSRQVEGLGNEGDVLLGISTSGNSENVLLAADMAVAKRMQTIGLLGGNGGKAKEKFEHTIIVPSDLASRIQEGHITIGHILCDLIERLLFDW